MRAAATAHVAILACHCNFAKCASMLQKDAAIGMAGMLQVHRQHTVGWSST